MARGSLKFASLFFALLPVSSGAEERIDFNDQIRPLLSDRCFTCHGFDANAREADLRLDTPEGAFTEDKHGIAPIVPGDPMDSEVWLRIISDDADEVMPPPDSLRQLSDADKALIKRWIEQGAEYEPHWTFVAVEKPKTDLTKGHEIDQLVSEKLKQEELELSPLADPRTLVRRLSFDLRGLPPTLEEVEKFAANPTEESWAILVEHYLAHPAYGERMAWPWLEAARYADTNGFQGDNERTMWPWRDWVIEAFNKNLPYDDFTVWQIAGDLLPNATFEQKLASGFLRNHAINGEGGSIPEENRVNYVFDMAETVGTVWMGLTFNCCRCHDHKYDPLSQKEYYGLNAFFNQTPVGGGGGDPQTKPVLPVASGAQKAEEEKLANQLEDIRKQLFGTAKQASGDQKKWENTQLATHKSPWSILPVKSAKSAKGQKLSTLENGTLLATGANPHNDDYTIELSLNEAPLTGILLKALRHPDMTKEGIARSNSGNFVLTEFNLALRSTDGTSKSIKIKKGQATFEQGSLKIAGVLDKNPASGWAILNNNAIPTDHAAVFEFEHTLQPAPGDTLVATLKHESKHANHNLGHFSIEGTSQTAPTLPKDQSFINALRTPSERRTKAQHELVNDSYGNGNPQFAELQKKEAAAKKKLNDFRNRLPKVMIMADQEKKRKTYILSVGAYDQRGEEVEAHTPAFLPPLGKKENANRLDLAQWIVSAKNPLTSRVTVNRLWQEFFGIGLVKSPEDFGVQSEIPVHPRLLDWLAADFMEHNWDYKHLVRTIVTSRTYRQSSNVSSLQLERDPDNRLLARGPRLRLSSWMIRDQALAASGLLVPKIGGAPVKPWQPEGLWSEVTFGKKKYAPDSGEKLRRRSLYTFWRRISAPPMFFDTAKREMCEVGTSLTNSPLHALAILNDPHYTEAARSLVNRAAKESSTEPEVILARAFKILLSRSPHPEELRILVKNYEQALPLITEEEAKALLAIGETPAHPELPPITQAALTSVCLSLLNTGESLTKE